MDSTQLEKECRAAMFALCVRAKAAGFPLRKFRAMLEMYPGVDAARILMGKTADLSVVADLFLLNRSELTVEFLVLKEKWRPLFSDAERAEAARRTKRSSPKMPPRKKPAKAKRRAQATRNLHSRTGGKRPHAVVSGA